MLRTRKTIGAAAYRAKLDATVAAVHRGAEGTEADPFDDAMIAAVVGIAEALQAEADALAELDARMGRVVRRV